MNIVRRCVRGEEGIYTCVRELAMCMREKAKQFWVHDSMMDIVVKNTSESGGKIFMARFKINRRDNVAKEWSMKKRIRC